MIMNMGRNDPVHHISEIVCHREQSFIFFAGKDLLSIVEAGVLGMPLAFTSAEVTNGRNRNKNPSRLYTITQW